MKRVRPAFGPLGLALVLLVGALTLGARTQGGGLPPGVRPGVKLYYVQTSNREAFWVPPTTPVEVRATDGRWVQVSSNAIDRDPLWLNFDQVVQYRTEL
jgi:hypothetical protein